ncbi:hypothetical protein EDB89DRAFT_575398 [Lactarius sanguifluus]|nr:hypothetical protein EDB89DRAFT_575398 [Lactarius sanguifluus]
MAQVCRSKGLHAQDSCRPGTTIGKLPDDVLLEIFDSYRSKSLTRQYDVPVWPWHLLVHVCRKWRQIVFESPLRLNLQILCTHRTPVRKILRIWPALPIAISYHPTGRSKTEGKLIEALKHPDRVCYVSLDLTIPQLGKMVAGVMQKPFPVLTRLNVFLYGGGDSPVLPANFLGGSAPCLQTIRLHGIPFPALPSLLLSASHLVNLTLFNIPPTGYISPEAMVASLAELPRLEIFAIGFRSATSRPDRIHPPPVIRTVLPALTYFHFQGASEYLEDLVARIDGPQLGQILTLYFNQLVGIQVTQLSKFIDRSVIPNLSKIMQVAFFNTGVTSIMHSHLNHRPIWTSAFCNVPDGQFSLIARVLSQFSAASSKVSHLKLVNGLVEDCRIEDPVCISEAHRARCSCTGRIHGRDGHRNNAIP